MKKKVFSLMMTLLLAFMGIARADELTVNDGTTTNGFVPVYGFYADAYLKCEFVQPAADLAAMAGATINGLTFYASQSSVSWGSANFEVFLTEVDNTTLSTFVGDGTIVYQGALSIVDGMMNVTFTEPYTYNGGNLLIGVYNLAAGDYVTSTWYGVSATGASVQYYSYSSLSDITATQRDFLPKTTFDYTPGGGTTEFSEIIDFEDNAMPAGWTVEGPGNWTVGTGDYSSSTGAHGGSYNALINHGATGNKTYLVSPMYDFANAIEGTVNCWFINRSWAGDKDYFGVYYRVNGGAWQELYYTTSAHSSWTEMGEIQLTGFANNYQIGFLMEDKYGYGVGLDDIEINVTLGDGPDYEVVEAIEINGFEAPTWAAALENNTYIPEDANYTLVESYWDYYYPSRGETKGHHGRLIEPDPNFTEDGRAYYMCFEIEANEGYGFTSGTQLLLNGDANMWDESISEVNDYDATLYTVDFLPSEAYEEGLHTYAMYGVGEEAYENIDRLLIERPNGAWMEPYHFQLYNDGTEDVEVVLIDFLHNNGYFSMAEGTEYPIAVAAEGLPGVDLYINTNIDWDETEELNSLLAVNTSERSTHLYQIVAAPYQPYCPDVVETAFILNGGNALTDGFTWSKYMSEIWDGPANEYELHANYDLPDYEENIPDGYDAVMKFTVNQPMSLTAHVVEGYENGKVALYRADSNDEARPMATNNYTGRPMSGGGSTPAGGGFEAVIGNVESTTSGSYVPFYTLYNYSLSESLYLASELTAASITTAPMTSLSWYATNAPGYEQQGISIWMANVSDEALTTTSHTVSGMTLVYTGSMTPQVGWNEFAFNQGSFAWDGQSNVLILVQRNNGTWNSTVYWTDNNVGFVATAYNYQDGAAYNVNTPNTVSTSNNRPIITMKGGNRANRDEFTYGFESDLEGWTVIDVNAGEGTWLHSGDNLGGYDYTTVAHGGTGFAMCYSYVDYDGAYDTDSYLVSPQQYTLDANSSITFWADNANDDYPESFSVCVSTAANPTAGSFTQVWGGSAKGRNNANAEVRHNNDRYDNWRSHNVNLGAYAGQSVWIAFHDVNYDAYEIWIDDVTVNAASSAPTPVDPVDPVDPVAASFHYWSAGPEIESLNVVPGTYYLVASSTEADFEVEFGINDLPCPEKAMVLSPVDNADSLDPTGVVLRWALSPDCIQYRLVFGSTYYPQEGHPQTIITDWTSDLAESYALPALWNNTNYFWRIEQRTGYSDENPGCVTVSDIWGFTTHLNVPQNLRANDETIFEDEPLTLTWNPIVDRTYRHYRVYQDGEMIYETTSTPNPETYTTYTIPAGQLTYNMEGYTFYVTAVYDEGESAPSNEVNVKVSGYSNTTGINGYAYEMDGVTPIGGVTVTIEGTDEFGDPHTYTTTTNANGYYSQVVYAGNYTMAVANKPGYQETVTNHTLPFTVAHNGQENNVNFIMDELFVAPAHVCAQPVYVEGVEGDTLVQVWWDFNFCAGDYEAQIGNGTTTTGYCPFYTLYNYSIATALYRAEELVAAGVTTAPMTSLSWYASNTTGYAQQGITIWMANVNDNTVSTTSPLTAGMTKVYTGAMTPVVGWNEFVFNEGDFEWDGESNIIIVVQRLNGEWNSTVYWNGSNAGFNAMSYDYDDYEVYNVENQTYTMSTSTTRPNIIMKGSCDRGGEDLTRSLHHYNIYRTDCYNDGPYNSENTDFISTAWVPDTSYFDVGWPNLEPGVYKYGVSAVYAGNRDDVVEYPAEERESEIVWHNLCSPCIDKDMQMMDVTVNVVLNSADNPEGTVVTFTNVNLGEQQAHPIAPVVLDQTGYYEFPTFRRGVYEVLVEHPGFYSQTHVIDLWNDDYFVDTFEDNTVTVPGHDLRFVLTEIICKVQNLYVSRTGWAMWDPQEPCPGGAMPGPTPGPTPGPGTEFSFGFEEDPEANGWTIQSLNSTTWVREETTQFDAVPHEGQYQMWLHWAYGDQDEWLITPSFAVPANANLTFWTYGQMGSTYGDHYYCKISTDGGSSWTELWDASAQAAGENHYTSAVSINLGAYAGQTVKLAWQGYAIDGLWYAWCIDDITVAAGREVISFDGRTWLRQPVVATTPAGTLSFSKDGSRAAAAERHLEGYKVLCTSIDGEPIFSENTVHNFCQLAINNPDALIPGNTYKCKVAAIYSTGMSEYEEVDWLYQPCYEYAGTVNGVTAEGNTITWDYPGSVPPGPTPPPAGETSFTEGFEGGLNGWNVLTVNADGGQWLHSDNNPGGYDYTTHAHGGTGFAMCYSFVDYDGAYDTDSYLYTPQKYDIVNGSTLTFWADNANDTYPESFSVCVSTADAPTASSFTQVWSGSAKGNSNAKANVRRDANRYDNWRSHSVDLSAYAGQSVWIAFHDVNEDQYEVWIDDVELTAGRSRDEFTYGFESGLDGWNVLTVNADGGQWLHSDNNPGGYDYTTHAHGGTGFAMCYSFVDYDGAYDTDSYLYSPQKYDIANGSTLTFWADNANDTYPESFSVCVATADSPTASDFTQVWSGSAKGNGNAKANVRRDANRYDNWRSHSVDLSAYAGQSVWIAFHDVNYDMYEVWIDDVTITASSTPTPPTPPTPAEGILGAMIFVDGEWEAFVEAPINTYTYEGEGENICVRIVYGGTAETPANNFYYAMSCEECVGDDTEMCPAGAPIFGDVDVNDQIRIWWGNDGRSWHGKIEKYNVYRSTDNVDYALIGEVSTARDNYYEYFDAPGVGGTYYYQVTAVYSDGCESAPAISGENPDQNYVMFGITGIGENNAEVNLFPNPTMGNVTIQAMNMHRITVVSVLGQVVFDTELDQDEYILNMAKFNTGMYMVRVYTDEGVTVKRVTVLH